jgi:hypothetical protein
VCVWKYSTVATESVARMMTRSYTSNMLAQQVTADIWAWIKNFVEQNHRFYDHRFPPCPYARAARLQGLVDVHACTGNAYKWTHTQIDNLVANKQYHVRVLAFPYWQRWNYLLRWSITRRNSSLVRSDYYAQFGAAVSTHSVYPGVFRGRPYFVVIINKVSDVVQAQASLARTDYYQNWTEQHYHNVVVKRSRVFKGLK